MIICILFLYITWGKGKGPIFFSSGYPVVQVPSVEKIVLFLLSCPKPFTINWPHLCGSASGLLCSIGVFVCLIYHTVLDYLYESWNQPSNQVGKPSNLVLFQNCFGYYRFFAFSLESICQFDGHESLLGILLCLC